jgi:FecR protein
MPMGSSVPILTGLLIGALAVSAHAGSAEAEGAVRQQQAAEGGTSAAGPCVVTQDGDTRVRSAAISHVQGQVGFDRGKGSGMERAVRSVPVIEGMKLVTADGYAEVGFEDGTHLRLTPSTMVAFDQLGLHKTGMLATAVGVRLGTVYVVTKDWKGSEMRLQVGETCIAVSHSTHLRLEITPERIELAVFTGTASVEGPAGHVVVVRKSQSLPFRTAEGGMATIVPGIEVRPNDDWEMEAMKLYEPHFIHRPPPSVWH